MAEWYSLGYFHDNMLMVKRACDEHFYSLGDLVRLKGNVPFSDSPFAVFIYLFDIMIYMIIVLILIIISGTRCENEC